MTSRTRTAAPWYALYAENARAAGAQDTGQTCAVCNYALMPGERVADLIGGRGPAHVACVSAQADRIGGRH